MSIPKNIAALISENTAAKAVVLAALVTLTALGCSASDLLATASSSSSSSAPPLQGTWLWKSDRTPADKGVKATFTQRGTTVSGRAVYPDGSDYMLFEGTMSGNGSASFATFWRGEIIPDPGAAPCSPAAVAQFFRNYSEAQHPDYARGSMVLKYDTQAQAFVGSKSYFHVFCEGDSVVKVEVPQESVTLTRAAADSYPEEGLLSILGACAGFACVVILLGLGAFFLVRSLNRRRA